MSHLSDIGFGFESPQEFLEFVQNVVNNDGNVGFTSPNGHYMLWTTGNGVELWIHADSALQLNGCGIHFRGEGRMRVHITQTFISGETPLHGCLYGWLNPSDEDNPYSGELPFAASVPNFDFVAEPLLRSPMVTLQVAAFVEKELRCYMSDGAYHSVRGRSASPSEIFESDWDQGDSPGEPSPMALCGGRVLSVEMRTNPASNLPFYSLLVKTRGGTIDMIADPETLRGKPVEGGIVQASCWLSAAVLTELHSTDTSMQPSPTFRQKREARARTRA
jgi:hypothetical protein